MKTVPRRIADEPHDAVCPAPTRLDSAPSPHRTASTIDTAASRRPHSSRPSTRDNQRVLQTRRMAREHENNNDE